MVVSYLLTIIYELSLWIIALIAIPKTIYNFFVYKKYRKSFLARLGWQDLNVQKNSESFYIWIHAVSVGETKAVVKLARELKKRFKHCRLIFSSTTETGHAEAKRSLPFADYHIYLPFDFNWIVHSTLKKVSPKLVILCESDLWYNFLRQAKKRGAAIALVNGKLSERSASRFAKASFFSHDLMQMFDLICVQNTVYRNRFMDVDGLDHKLVVTGNLKLDEEYHSLTEAEMQSWKNQLGIEANQLVLTIGSTHMPEEELLIPILQKLWTHLPHLKVILAPRHPERVREVLAVLEKAHVSFITLTAIEAKTGKEQVIVVDGIGKLRACYQVCDVAVVAGSYTHKVGGHNILEPCSYGKPALFGPYMHTQMELVRLVEECGAGKQTTLENLCDELLHLFSDNELRRKMGQQGLHLMQDVRGSTDRTLKALEPLLERLN